MRNDRRPAKWSIPTYLLRKAGCTTGRSQPHAKVFLVPHYLRCKGFQSLAWQNFCSFCQEYQPILILTTPEPPPPHPMEIVYPSPPPLHPTPPPPHTHRSVETNRCINHGFRLVVIVLPIAK